MGPQHDPVPAQSLEAALTGMALAEGKKAQEDGPPKRLGPIKNQQRLVKRNETCPYCRSGKKFKHCCKRTYDAFRPAARAVLE